MKGPHLEKHQETALKKMHDGCILWGGVGSGKSRVALAYYMQTDGQMPIIVITTAKKRDSLEWQGEAANFAIGLEESVAGVLTIDSWNNIEKYIDCENCFFVFDEQRLVGTGKWVKSFYKIAKKNKWIMLTATPGDTWLDYAPVFIANNYYKNITQFKREHVVYNTFTKFPKVDRYIGVQKLARLRSEIVVHMLYYSEAERISKTCWVDYDKEKLQTVTNERWNIYEDRPIRDIAEMFHVARRVVNSDPSRLEALLELHKRKKRIIVFYNFNYELDMLRSLFPGHGLHGEWNGHKHESIPAADYWFYLVQYTAGAEGWNCTSTDTMVFWSLTYSYKAWEQSHGRIDRMNTPYEQLYYYSLRSRSWIDEAIWRALGQKRSFNEGSYWRKNPQIA